MGVGIFLRGRVTSPASLLDRLANRLEGEPWFSSLRVDAEAVEVVLHPAAESVDFVLEAGESLRVMAKTSTVGPGYHAYLVDLLRALGDELGVHWDEAEDDTGYFANGDFATVEQEMLAWIGGVARLVLQKDAMGLMVSLPTTHRFVFDGALATPVGPRELAWVEAVATDPARGMDLFPWWGRGRDARQLLGTVLCRMWTEVRWREPITDEEEVLRQELLADLAAAFAEDASLDYPWREWASLGGESPRVLAAAASATGPLVGYRRRPVRVDLPGGWSLELPGEFAEEQEESGRYLAFDERHTLSFTAFRKEGTAEALLAPDEVGVGARQHVGARVRSWVAVADGADEAGEPFRKMTVRAARLDGGRMAMLSLVWPVDVDGAWAERIWLSLDHHG